MAKYRITGPDGSTYEVTAPDSASQAEVMSFVQQHQANHDKIAAQIANDPISQGAKNFNSGTSDFENFVASYGKAGADLARGAGQLIPGLVSRQDVAESRRLDAPLMATKAGKAGNFIGNVVNTAPLAFAAGSIPAGLAVGAATGLIQPSTSNTETALNTGLGAAAGAAVPVAQRLWQVGKAAVEPMYQAGQEAIVGRTLNAAAGRDAHAVANRLQAAARPFTGPSQGVPRTIMGEYVPGSMPTVGQAAENAGIASLESAATANNPAVTNALHDAIKAQNAARTGVLKDMAGTDGAREFFDANRKAAAQQLYERAYKAGLPKLTAQQESIVTDLLSRPAVKGGHMNPGAVDEAKLLMRNEGLNVSDPAGSVQGLDYVVRALGDKIGKTTPGSNEARILTGIKDKLVGWLDQVSPKYADARTTFAEMSRPINQMDVAKKIVDQTIDPLTGNLQPSSYAKLVTRDGTAAKALKFGGATLENTMEPTQLNALNSILLDVQRSTAAQNAGRGIGSDTVRKLAYSNLMEQSGLPTFVRDLKPAQILGNLAGRGADAVYGRANREISNRLAEVMLDPGMAAELMRRATPAQKNQLAALVAQGASGLALAAPASANALQH